MEGGVPRSRILHSRLKRLEWSSISLSIMSERSFPARSTVDTQPPIVCGGDEGKEGEGTKSLRNHLPLSLFRRLLKHFGRYRQPQYMYCIYVSPARLDRLPLNL